MGESRPWQTDVPTQHSSITTTKEQASKATEQKSRGSEADDRQQLVVGQMAACPGINEPTHPSRVVASRSKEELVSA